jgi:hypothetical protein
MTLDLGELNYIAIIVSVVATQVLGTLWYSNLLFGKTWRAEIGMTAEQWQARSSQARAGYIMAILGSLIAAWVLAMLIQATDAADVIDGIVLGLMVSIGFVATAIAINYVFESKSLKLFLITAGYPVVSLLITGIILTLWG